jgi:hypothetical protein
LYGILGVGAAVLSSSAQVDLIEGNTKVSINPTAQAGMYDWIVDGQDYLAQQWLWYRVGSGGPEFSLDSLTYAGGSQPLPDQAILNYTSTSFDVQLTYALTGGSVGSGVSDVAESIKIINNTASALDFHLFLYSDFDMAGTALGDTVTSVTYFPYGSSPGYNSVTQVEGADLNQTTFGTFANRAEAGLSTTILGKLNDGSSTDLLNAVGGFGPVTSADMSYAFQWNLSIAAGASKTITVDKRLDIVPIPEPTTAALSLLGLAALFHASRRRRV